MYTANDQIQNLSVAYKAAKERQDYLNDRDCSMNALYHVLASGATPRGRWPETIARLTLPDAPTVGDLDAASAERRSHQPILKAASEALYKGLLEAGIAYEVFDHSARLASRPFEVRPADLPWATRSFVSAHGSHLRLARYASREAAEAAAARVTEQELARLSN